MNAQEVDFLDISKYLTHLFLLQLGLWKLRYDEISHFQALVKTMTGFDIF
jgi:hypothetical protein